MVRSRTRCSISRGELFTPRLAFDDLAALNAWLLLRCEELAERRHTDQQYRTIAEVFADEKIELRPARAALSTVMSKKLCGSDPLASCSMTGEEGQKTVRGTVFPTNATACRANMRGITSRCAPMLIALS